MNNGNGAGSHLADLYRLDESHGWAQGMRQVTFAFLTGLPFAKGPFLDLGCGGGVFVHELAEMRPQSFVLGADLSATALAYAQAHSGGERLLQADVNLLPLAAQSIALVTALDSLDQVGVDIDLTLAEVRRVLRPDGLLLLRVSTQPWLWGPHDVAFNTGRRWRLHELVKHVEQAGLQVVRTTYANSLLSPVIVVLRLLQRWGGWPLSSLVTEKSRPNALLLWALAGEASWLEHHRFPFGISLYVLARLPLRAVQPLRVQL